jgi:hypothetical protein
VTDLTGIEHIFKLQFFTNGIEQNTLAIPQGPRELKRASLRCAEAPTAAPLLL